MRYTANPLLSSLLRDVSRSFYLTLRVLPSAIRPQVGLAYLLARTSDTIADTELVPLDKRLTALQSFRERILGSRASSLDFGELARQQASQAERILLEKCEESLNLLGSLTSSDRELVVGVLQTILSGQELDLRRFAAASPTNIVALRAAEELDDYTYRVAGCVGEFWTRTCRTHLFASTELDDAFLLSNGVRFGKGLQLTNILRDLPVDLRHGRCYLPSQRLEAHGLQPQDLLERGNESRLRPVYDAYLDEAEAHLAAGWSYTNALPRRSMRLRLACSWPLLIGRQTLSLLRTGMVLDPNHRLKVNRREVKRILCRSVILYPWAKRWEQLFPTACKDH
jgi:farnesyl-diphosphate farnesyltransferase